MCATVLNSTMVALYLLDRLNELRVNNVGCDLDLISSDRSIYPIHQLVFTALNQRLFKSAVENADAGIFDVATKKKMILSKLTSQDLEIMIDFLYGKPVTERTLYDELSAILARVDMSYLLGEAPAPSDSSRGTADSAVVKSEPAEEPPVYTATNINTDQNLPAGTSVQDNNTGDPREADLNSTNTDPQTCINNIEVVHVKTEVVQRLENNENNDSNNLPTSSSSQTTVEKGKSDATQETDVVHNSPNDKEEIITEEDFKEETIATIWDDTEGVCYRVTRNSPDKVDMTHEPTVIEISPPSSPVKPSNSWFHDYLNRQKLKNKSEIHPALPCAFNSPQKASRSSQTATSNTQTAMENTQAQQSNVRKDKPPVTNKTASSGAPNITALVPQHRSVLSKEDMLSASSKTLTVGTSNVKTDGKQSAVKLSSIKSEPQSTTYNILNIPQAQTTNSNVSHVSQAKTCSNVLSVSKTQTTNSNVLSVSETQTTNSNVLCASKTQTTNSNVLSVSKTQTTNSIVLSVSKAQTTDSNLPNVSQVQTTKLYDLTPSSSATPQVQKRPNILANSAEYGNPVKAMPTTCVNFIMPDTATSVTKCIPDSYAVHNTLLASASNNVKVNDSLGPTKTCSQSLQVSSACLAGTVTSTIDSVNKPVSAAYLVETRPSKHGKVNKRMSVNKTSPNVCSAETISTKIATVKSTLPPACTDEVVSSNTNTCRLNRPVSSACFAGPDPTVADTGNKTNAVIVDNTKKRRLSNSSNGVDNLAVKVTDKRKRGQSRNGSVKSPKSKKRKSKDLSCGVIKSVIEQAPPSALARNLSTKMELLLKRVPIVRLKRYVPPTTDTVKKSIASTETVSTTAGKENKTVTITCLANTGCTNTDSVDYEVPSACVEKKSTYTAYETVPSACSTNIVSTTNDTGNKKAPTACLSTTVTTSAVTVTKQTCLSAIVSTSADNVTKQAGLSTTVTTTDNVTKQVCLSGTVTTSSDNVTKQAGLSTTVTTTDNVTKQAGLSATVSTSSDNVTKQAGVSGTVLTSADNVTKQAGISGTVSTSADNVTKQACLSTTVTTSADNVTKQACLSTSLTTSADNVTKQACLSETNSKSTDNVTKQACLSETNSKSTDNVTKKACLSTTASTSAVTGNKSSTDDKRRKRRQSKQGIEKPDVNEKILSTCGRLRKNSGNSPKDHFQKRRSLDSALDVIEQAHRKYNKRDIRRLDLKRNSTLSNVPMSEILLVKPGNYQPIITNSNPSMVCTSVSQTGNSITVMSPNNSSKMSINVTPSTFPVNKGVPRKERASLPNVRETITTSRGETTSANLRETIHLDSRGTTTPSKGNATISCERETIGGSSRETARHSVGDTIFDIQISDGTAPHKARKTTHSGTETSIQSPSKGEATVPSKRQTTVTSEAVLSSCSSSGSNSAQVLSSSCPQSSFRPFSQEQTHDRFNLQRSSKCKISKTPTKRIRSPKKSCSGKRFYLKTQEQPKVNEINVTYMSTEEANRRPASSRSIWDAITSTSTGRAGNVSSCITDEQTQSVPNSIQSSVHSTSGSARQKEHNQDAIKPSGLIGGNLSLPCQLVISSPSKYSQKPLPLATHYKRELNFVSPEKVSPNRKPENLSDSNNTVSTFSTNFQKVTIIEVSSSDLDLGEVSEAETCSGSYSSNCTDSDDMSLSRLREQVKIGDLFERRKELNLSQTPIKGIDGVAQTQNPQCVRVQLQFSEQSSGTVSQVDATSKDSHHSNNEFHNEISVKRSNTPVVSVNLKELAALKHLTELKRKGKHSLEDYISKKQNTSNDESVRMKTPKLKGPVGSELRSQNPEILKLLGRKVSLGTPVVLSNVLTSAAKPVKQADDTQNLVLLKPLPFDKQVFTERTQVMMKKRIKRQKSQRQSLKHKSTKKHQKQSEFPPSTSEPIHKDMQFYPLQISMASSLNSTPIILNSPPFNLTIVSQSPGNSSGVALDSTSANLTPQTISSPNSEQLGHLVAPCSSNRVQIPFLSLQPSPRPLGELKQYQVGNYKKILPKPSQNNTMPILVVRNLTPDK